MRSKVQKFVAFALPLLVVLGCAVESLESDSAHLIDTELVGETQQALGSTKARVDISTWNALNAIASDGNYRLTADIDASGKTWTVRDFTGTFDGNGKTISNLTINTAGNVGFFRTLSQAIVKNVKFTTLNVTGTWMVGGLAGFATGSQVERVVIEGTITGNNGFAVGGIFGEMIGGSLYRSYAKGTVQSSWFYAGGLVGFVGGDDSSLGTISQSYAQTTVSTNTDDPNRVVNAGGIAGFAQAADIHDVYAVGNVTGRHGVGGLVGALACHGYNAWLLYRGIHRGDVVDKSAPTGGFAGVVGQYDGSCSARTAHLFYDRTADPSTNWSSIEQFRGTTTELRSATTPSGGIFCLRPENCPTDANFETTIWDAGTSSQHHILKNMPGPNAQLR